MGLYDGLPYELQSPTWRNAANYQQGQPNTWDAGLNVDFATRLVEAQERIAMANANGVNTTQIDGQTPFVEKLTSFGGALLASIGVRDDAPQAQPVAYGMGEHPERTIAGFPARTVMIAALLAGGAYLVWKG